MCEEEENMQTWEYMTLRVAEEMVMAVNAKPLDLALEECNLHNYLNKQGREGWEVAGVTTYNGAPRNFIVILRRSVT
jgi:hypothetical protein